MTLITAGQRRPGIDEPGSPFEEFAVDRAGHYRAAVEPLANVLLTIAAEKSQTRPRRRGRRIDPVDAAALALRGKGLSLTQIAKVLQAAKLEGSARDAAERVRARLKRYTGRAARASKMGAPRTKLAKR